MPTRIHIPKNWKYRATRALSNLNKPGFAAACFWCGHQYRSGEYSPETESEHLLLCPEFPKKGKQNIQKRKASKAEPEVGIVFLVGAKLFIDSTPFSQAGEYGHHLIHERGHDEYWRQLLKWEPCRARNTKSTREVVWPTTLRLKSIRFSLTDAS